jgi:hypothetical protein
MDPLSHGWRTTSAIASGKKTGLIEVYFDDLVGHRVLNCIRGARLTDMARSLYAWQATAEECLAQVKRSGFIPARLKNPAKSARRLRAKKLPSVALELVPESEL